MNVLLSIKPKYAESIINGYKKYEFRKIIFKKKRIEYVYIYATTPVQKIVGFFRIGEIIADRPESLWDRLNEFSGLDEEEFFAYFENYKVGFAIEIKNVEKFETPLDPNKLISKFVPPQSFCYLKSPLVKGSSISEEKHRRLQDY